MSATRYSDAAANSMFDGGLVAYINTGAGVAQFKFYNGSMPATGDTAISGQTLLGTLDCSDPIEAGAAASRTLTFDTITGANAAATGTCTFLVLLNGNGDKVLYADVGSLSSTAACKLASTTFTSGLPIAITAAAISIPTTISG